MSQLDTKLLYRVNDVWSQYRKSPGNSAEGIVVTIERKWKEMADRIMNWLFSCADQQGPQRPRS